jgi:hypothetical protein
LVQNTFNLPLLTSLYSFLKKHMFTMDPFNEPSQLE